MKKPLAEFLGTFFLVLTIGCVAIPGTAGPFAPLAIAACLLAMIFALGHVSGAHFNPAITLAMILRGRCQAREAFPYVFSQLAAAGAASYTAVFLTGNKGTPLVVENIPAALAAEFLFTFALAFVILNVATARGTAGNSFYGLAISFLVLAGAYAVGSISGAAFNPAVALALPIMNLLEFRTVWVHLAGEISGALLAVLAFRFLHPEPDGPAD